MKTRLASGLLGGAHDNDVLDKAEATYVVSIVSATLSLINAIE